MDDITLGVSFRKDVVLGRIGEIFLPYVEIKVLDNKVFFISGFCIEVSIRIVRTRIDGTGIEVSKVGRIQEIGDIIEKVDDGIILETKMDIFLKNGKVPVTLERVKIKVIPFDMQTEGVVILRRNETISIVGFLLIGCCLRTISIGIV